MNETFKGFRFHLIKLLAAFNGNEDEKRLITRNLKNDLEFWKKVTMSTVNGIPLAWPECDPPAKHVTFYSDAAGGSFEIIDGKMRNTTIEGERGTASIGSLKSKWDFVKVFKWPRGLLKNKTDSKGRFFASKSAVLEMVGAMIPLLTIPKELLNEHIVLIVDNMNIVYSWQKKYCKKDEELSILLRCLCLIECVLESKIYIVHEKRMSSKNSALTDRLTRESSMTNIDKCLLSQRNTNVTENPVTDWLTYPVADWTLPERTAVYLQNILENKN